MSAPPGAPRPVIPRSGDVLKIHEVDYRYGVGELLLRVTAIGGACGDLEPCPERERLTAVFARYEQLPRRRPGVTGVADRGAKAGAGRSWFVVFEQPRY